MFTLFCPPACLDSLHPSLRPLYCHCATASLYNLQSQMLAAPPTSRTALHKQPVSPVPGIGQCLHAPLPPPSVTTQHPGLHSYRSAARCFLLCHLLKRRLCLSFFIFNHLPNGCKYGILRAVDRPHNRLVPQRRGWSARRGADSLRPPRLARRRRPRPCPPCVPPPPAARALPAAAPG